MIGYPGPFRNPILPKPLRHSFRLFPGEYHPGGQRFHDHK